MKPVIEWLTKKPLGLAVLCLVVGLANGFEAAYIDNPGGFMSVFSWVCAAGGVLGCLFFLLTAVSDYLSKPDD